MSTPRKIVVNSISGYRPEFDVMAKEWMRAGVIYVGIVGVEAARLEGVVDELCVGDGSNRYFMLTASHGPSEGLADAVAFAEQLSGAFAGPVAVVAF